MSTRWDSLRGWYLSENSIILWWTSRLLWRQRWRVVWPRAWSKCSPSLWFKVQHHNSRKPVWLNNFLKSFACQLCIFLIYYSNCTLPDCWCSSDGTLVPGGLSPTDVPQMVTITFDDAINDENWRLYSSRLFPQTRKNPNGCPVNFLAHTLVLRKWIKYFKFKHIYWFH